MTKFPCFGGPEDGRELEVMEPDVGRTCIYCPGHNDGHYHLEFIKTAMSKPHRTLLRWVRTGWIPGRNVWDSRWTAPKPRGRVIGIDPATGDPIYDQGEGDEA